MVDSWAEHQRHHGRFTVAARENENRVINYAMRLVEVLDFIYAREGYYRILHETGPPPPLIDDEDGVSQG
jgi:hypothetical protein